MADLSCRYIKKNRCIVKTLYTTTFFAGCVIRRCPMMQKRKAYFENSDQQKIFPHCITAVGKGLRESWGSFNEKRKKCIKMLKQNCPNWQGLAEQNVKLAWHCRKLRLLQENEQDLNTVMELDLQEYSPKEINWLRKI